jgi:hypothetical protein
VVPKNWLTEREPIFRTLAASKYEQFEQPVKADVKAAHLDERYGHAVAEVGITRWLLRELSTDYEDMIALVASLADADDDDAQALLNELAAPRTVAATGPLRADYQDGKRLLVDRL